MADSIFLSFDFERDFHRAEQIKKVWNSQPNRTLHGLWDLSGFPILEEQREVQFKKYIDDVLKRSQVTVVLIGQETSQRSYVQYAVKESHRLDKGMFGIYVHKIKDGQGNTSKIGNAQFGEIGKSKDNQSIFFWKTYPLYRWVTDGGKNNLKKWVDTAAEKADVAGQALRRLVS